MSAEEPGAAAAVLEMLLEGLHLGRRLSKDVDPELGDWLGGDVDGDTVFSS